MALRLLAFAVSYGRLSSVFLIGDTLIDWRISDRAAKSRGKARRWAQRIIDDLQPDVIVTEEIKAASKKGDRSKSIVAEIAAIAVERKLLGASICRQQEYNNKYEEAEAIAKRYPELQPWVPKHRRFFDNEPRNAIVFEAMSLALLILQEPSSTLAAAMG